MNPHDASNSNGSHFLQPGMHTFPPPRYPPSANYPQLTGYPPPMVPLDHVSSSSGSQAIASPALECPPVNTPHLGHSRRTSRDSRDSSSSQSTPSTGNSGSNTHDGLVIRNRRGHVSSSMSPPLSPTASIRKSKKSKKKDVPVEAPDEDAMTDGEDPGMSQKLRREDAKRSRQDAEQKRRDQLKGAYDQLRLVIPGSNEKTSKVMLVNHARSHIDKLSRDKTDLLVRAERAEDDLSGLRQLNERLIKKLIDHGIDFKDDLEATGMELPPQDEPKGFQTAPPRTPLDVPMLGNPGMGPRGGLPLPHPSHSGNFTQHRGGHSRNPSNISIHHFGSESSLSGSSSHNGPISGYQALPPSTPVTPLRPSVMMGPPPQPGIPPQLQVAVPGGIHPGSSSAALSPASGPTAGQGMFTADGHLMYTVDDPMSSSPTRGLPPQMMTMNQAEYMRQRSSQPGRPPHVYHEEPSSIPGAPGMNAAAAQAGHGGFGLPTMIPPGSRNDIDRHGHTEHDGSSGSSHDSQLHRNMSQQGSSTFGSSDGPSFYGESHDPSQPFTSDFVQYPPEERQAGTEMYIPASPSGSQVRTPQTQPQLQPSNAHPHLQVPPQGVHHQHLVAGIAPAMTSPHPSDRSGPGHSPHMPNAFPTTGPQLTTADGGINPTIIMGEVNQSVGAEVRPPHSAEGPWYPADPGRAP